MEGEKEGWSGKEGGAERGREDGKEGKERKMGGRKAGREAEEVEAEQ